MALSSSVINIKRGANAPPVRIAFTDVDLTGSTVEMVLTSVTGAPAPFTISTDDAELALSLPDGIMWTYSEDRADGLLSGVTKDWPLGRTLVDFWRISGESRDSLGSGVVRVYSAGSNLPGDSTVIEVPGIQGPRGWAPLFAAEEYGTSVVLKVADWTGGGGGKPAVGQYLGPDGMVDDIGEATLFASVEGANAAIEAAAAFASAAAEDRALAQTAASTATNQAGIATTQAGNAATSAAASASSATASDAAVVLAEAASAAAVAAAAETPLSMPTWAALVALTPTSLKQRATVSTSDAGTHTGRTAASPGSDVGSVPNSGIYGAYALTAGAWRRDGAVSATGLASAAETITGTSTTLAVTPEGDKAALEARVGQVINAAPAGYAFAVTDEFGLASFGVTLSGDTRIATINGKLVTEWQIETAMAGVLVPYAPPGYAYAWLDDLDNAPVGIKSDGTLAAVRVEATYLNGVAVAGIIAGGGGGGATVYRRRYGAEIEMVLSYGQSLSVGADAVPVITTTQRFDNLKFEGGVRSEDSATPYTALVPLTETAGISTLGETPIGGATDAIKELILSEDGLSYTQHDYQLLGSAPGAGGAYISLLGSGTTPFNRFVADVQAGFDLAQASGESCKVGAFFWTQGESDYSQSTPKATYKAALVQLRDDLEADVVSITGQAEPLVCISYQTQAHTVYGYTGNPYIAVAQLEVAKENAHHYVACPLYWSPQLVHQSAQNSKRLGAYYGLCYKRVVIDGEDWMPVMPVQIDRQGKVITARFHVPRGQLKLDTTLLTLKTAYGFSVATSGGSAVTVDSVSLIGPDTVKIVTATDAGTNSRLRYGFGTSGGNLRDTQGETIIFDGGGLNYPMHNWCVIFDETMA